MYVFLVGVLEQCGYMILAKSIAIGSVMSDVLCAECFNDEEG